MKNTLLYLFVMLGVLTTACDKQTNDDGYSGLAAGQNANISGLNIAVTRIQDNSCPKDVQCVRAGEILVDFEMKKNAETKSITLCLLDCNIVNKTSSYTFIMDSKTYILTLKEVKSYPVSGTNSSYLKAEFTLTSN